MRVSEEKKLEVDYKFLSILGFTPLSATNDTSKKAESEYYKYETHNLNDEEAHKYTANVDIQHLPTLLQHEQQNIDNSHSTQSRVYKQTSHLFNSTKVNFTIVTYVQEGQAPSAILLSQNIALKFPNEHLIIYDLGLSEEDLKSLNAYCNNSIRCTVISYDLSVFPSHVADQRMHAYRPLVIKDALMRSKAILFAENFIRIRGSSRDLYDLKKKLHLVGVLGWNTPTAVSARTHPKMFEYFQTDADDFFFLRMVDLDTVLFEDTPFVSEKILLPWIKCALTLECLDPIGK